MPRFFLLSLLCVLVAGCAPDTPPVSDPPADARAVAATDSLDRAAMLIERPDASFPTIAADPTSGHAVVAWTDQVDGATAVLVARWDAQGLAEPVRVSPASDDVAAHGQAPAQVAVGPGGQVVVVYVAQTMAEGRRFPASDLRLARSTDGGRTFAPPITVNEDEGFLTGHHFHDLEVGPDGTVYVSWLDSRERDRPSHAAHLAAGTPVRRVSAHVHEAGTQVRMARSTDGGRSFAPSVVVAEGTCPCCRTNLALGPDGAVYVAWRHVFDTNIRDIALARSTDGGRTFAEPVHVHADGWLIDGCPHVGPAVAVDGDGRVHIVWYTGAAGGPGVHYITSDDGGRTFGPAQTLSEAVPIAQVSARSDSGGTWIAWEEPVEEQIRMAHVVPGQDTPVTQAVLSERDAPSLALAGGRWLLAAQHPDGIVVQSGDAPSAP